MKVKMVDVARRLGISKATVSLTLNGKPGVSEETRKKIFECLDEMKREKQMQETADSDESPRAVSDEELPASLSEKNGKIIKVMMINHQKMVTRDPELNVWMNVLETLNTEIRKKGYTSGLCYMNDYENAWDIIQECNMDMVAGVVIMGAEVEEKDRLVLEQIRKPIVLLDYESVLFPYSSVCIDNAMAVEQCFASLENEKELKVVYLSTSKDIYNFSKRREAFREHMLRNGKYVTDGDFAAMGTRVDEITENLCHYLRTHDLPDLFIAENYQVSAGMLSAAAQCGVVLGRDVQFIGIDRLPDYLWQAADLDYILVPHEERAVMAVDILDKTIQGQYTSRIRVFTETKRIHGGESRME